MQYTTKDTKNIGKVVTTSIHEITGKTDTTNVLIGQSLAATRVMVANTIRDGLKKGNQMKWNVGTDYEVSIWRETELSGYDKEDSEFLITKTNTWTKKGRIIISNIVKRRNPDFADNPECQFCYEKCTKLYNQTLLDDAKTPKKVCAKCDKTLKRMKKIMSEKEITN